MNATSQIKTSSLQKSISAQPNTNNEVKLLQAFKQQILVDPKNGPIKTIQQAINEAHPGCVIKIMPGLYQENLKINKPSLTLEPKEKPKDKPKDKQTDKLKDVEDEVIIIGHKGPVILIDIQKNEKCHLIGLKIAHTGMGDEQQLDKLIK